MTGRGERTGLLAAGSALVAVACCAAPGIVAIFGGLGALALGGASGAVLLLATGTVLWRLRRRRACRTVPGGHT